MPCQTIRILFLATFALAGGWGIPMITQGQTTTQTQTITQTQTLPTEGMLGWWDAARMATEAFRPGRPAPRDGDPLSHWLDASPANRNLIQADPDQRPRLTAVGDRWVIRFDGQSDHMRWVDRPFEIDAMTVFLVVAPHRNQGVFRGFLCGGELDGRDYQTGFNVDMGPTGTPQWDQLNLEGKGFGGAQNVLHRQFDFETLHQIQFTLDPQQSRVDCWVDGTPAGSRPWQPQSVLIEHLTLGARYYQNGPGKQIVQGPFQGDIAEVILYDRVLSKAEQAVVRNYLAEKHAELAKQLPVAMRALEHAVPLVKVDHPPPIQMLIPGFETRELPVELPNINNVRFRDDGTLVTLGYNGDIHLLVDTDGDGLEDRAEVFWKNDGSLRGPIGMQLTLPDSPHGRGVFVSSKGKVSLIVDTDHDDRADREIIVASGWEEIHQNVDAVGLAVDGEGHVYFGLGTANYANAYLVDEQGQSRYHLTSERGTVQRVSPDFSKRETVCTGVRFPIGFAFNSQGDLFCTDQEGATWLPNGNPFDELLHIQPGRHYGFPPRHPTYNPNVIDEPSTFDYGPQHQSTCGLVFNPSSGNTPFGPQWWADDALVCGESRGKIWRTKLVETGHGYVAASQLLACLQMLTVDACVAPDGDLVVACHSGPPDWGTGPTGTGKLFRIKMSQPGVPRPAATWAHSPNEIRIAFDQPLDPQSLRRWRDQVRVEYGSFVSAGDPFETLVPPYEVVRRQSLAPRFELPVNGTALTQDRKTVILNTATLSHRNRFAVTLPASVPKNQTGAAESIQVDTEFDLAGLTAEFNTATPRGDAGFSWTGWLPHGDLTVAKRLTAESSQHQELWQNLSAGGQLSLMTRLDLKDMLRPRVQPGSTLDYQWPDETVTVVIQSSAPIRLGISDPSAILTTSEHECRVTLSDPEVSSVAIQVHLDLSGGEFPTLNWSFFTREDERQRAIPLRRFVLPWSTDSKSHEETQPSRLAELEGGNWGRGRRVFHSETAGCFKCHAVGGDGGTIGPELANLVHRDYASVMRDVKHPSFAINPDYISQTVLLKDGRVLTGVLITRENELLIGDSKGVLTPLDPQQIETMQPSSVSAMPDGLLDKLSDQQRLDLMTFLLTDPPRMPLDGPLEAPPLRTQAEVNTLLSGAQTLPSPLKPLRIVLVAGPKDHGPGEHDYPAWQNRWTQLLCAARDVDVDTAWNFPSDDQLGKADVLIFFQKGDWNDERAAKLDAWQKRGGGAVYIHWAVNGGDRAADFAERIGLASQGGSISYRHGPLTLNMHSTDHPIMRNVDTMRLYDESYWRLSGHPENVTLLASSIEDGQSRPQVWAYQRGEGRVFVSIPGHYSWTFDDPLFRTLLLRGIAWTAKEPVDRFNELVPLGARMTR